MLESIDAIANPRHFTYNAAMFKPLLLTAALLAVGCTSHIVPLRPIQREEVWIPDTPATTAAATEASPATTAATQPGHMVTRVTDPNETSKFIYKGTYDNIWRQAAAIVTAAGFSLDRQDYRLGVMTSFALPSAQVVEFWKPQHVNLTDSLENTVNNQRRSVRVTISRVEGKPDFYQIGIQVLVERETNPREDIGGPVFVQGSGFGRNSVTLRSDYAEPNVEGGRWVAIGHDPDMERRMIEALFNRI
jgi:hypothetical protein